MLIVKSQTDSQIFFWQNIVEKNKDDDNLKEANDIDDDHDGEITYNFQIQLQSNSDTTSFLVWITN